LDDKLHQSHGLSGAKIVMSSIGRLSVSGDNQIRFSVFTTCVLQVLRIATRVQPFGQDATPLLLAPRGTGRSYPSISLQVQRPRQHVPIPWLVGIG
jgi:hypothetical protein